MENDVAMKTQQANAAQAAGNTEEAEKMREWCRGMQETLHKSKAMIQQSWIRIKASQKQSSQGSTQGQAGPSGSGDTSTIPAPVPAPAPETVPTAAPVQAPAPASAIPQQSPSISNMAPSSSSKNAAQAALPPPSNPPPAGPSSLSQMPMIPPNAPPEMAQQMQKLVDQRNASAMAGPRTYKCTLMWKGSTSGTHSRVEMHASVVMAFPDNASPVLVRLSSIETQYL